MSKFLAMFLIAVGLAGCEQMGGDYTTHNTAPSCDRAALVCTSGDCYYCEAVNLEGASKCIDTSWGHLKSEEPNEKEHKWDAIIFKSGQVYVRVLEQCK